MKIGSFNFYKKITLAVLLAGTVTGCEKLKDFGDTDVNPNGSPDVLTSALLTNVEVVAANLASVDGSTGLQAGMYCQYFTQSSYPGASLYVLPQLNLAGFYSGSLMDCQLIINKNTDPATKGLNTVTSGGGTENQIAIAKILQSYIFWTITDRWGNIPYSEALKGVSFLTPKYDAQQDVYKSILSTLTSSVAMLDHLIPPVKGDIIYSGSNAKWRQLANSLRMLVALRLSKQFPADDGYAAVQFKAAYEDLNGFIQANTDNFTVVFPGGNYRNPWTTISSGTDNAVAKTFTDLLQGLSDNRINSMATSTSGVPYGLENNVNPPFAQILNAPFSADNAPVVIVSSSSVWLAIAEAFERGWVTSGNPDAAQEAYETGVQRSFEQWGVTIPAAYLTTGPANYNTGAGVASIGGNTVPGASASTSSKLERIALQQYISYYPDGTQGWSNWRRSEQIKAEGVPSLKPTVNFKNLSGEIVRRFVYGITEYNLNGQQLQINLSSMPDGDSQDGRVWWDKQ